MTVSDSPHINMTRGDCMEAMADMEDNAYELAIVDPPYGIGEANEKQMLSRHHTQKKYKAGKWDADAPDSEYFDELFRVSKNQIIWGANHYISRMPFDSSCWVFWDKDMYGDFADGELAWTSFKTAVRMFKWTWDGFRKQLPEDRIHPTQKPVALYKWLLTNYATEGDRILDTHGGSGSIAIACYDMGFDLDWYELDKDYYNDAVERFKEHKKQGQLFRPQPKPQPKQGELI